jgi:hypothetical protein
VLIQDVYCANLRDDWVSRYVCLNLLLKSECNGTEITCLLEEELWHQKNNNMKQKLQNRGTHKPCKNNNTNNHIVLIQDVYCANLSIRMMKKILFAFSCAFVGYASVEYWNMTFSFAISIILDVIYWIFLH